MWNIVAKSAPHGRCGCGRGAPSNTMLWCSIRLRGARPTLLLGTRPTLPPALARPYRRRSGPHGHFKPGSSNRTPQLQAEVEPVGTAAAKKYKKMPMCISFGYVGSGFHGLQSQPKRPDLPTVAKTIRQALLESGAIAASNIEPLARTKWSLSSRTDKGVHATGAAASFRMETLPEQLEEHDGRLALGAAASATPRVRSNVSEAAPLNIRVRTPPRVSGSAEVARINGFLPPEVRVFGAARVRSSLDPRPLQPHVSLYPPSHVFEAVRRCTRSRPCVAGARRLRRAALRQLARVRVPAAALRAGRRLGGADACSRARARPRALHLPGLQP